MRVRTAWTLRATAAWLLAAAATAACGSSGSGSTDGDDAAGGGGSSGAFSGGSGSGGGSSGSSSGASSMSDSGGSSGASGGSSSGGGGDGSTDATAGAHDASEASADSTAADAPVAEGGGDARPDATATADAPIPDSASPDSSADALADVVDASEIDGATLCAPFTSSAPIVDPVFSDGSAPSPSTLTGGGIESGTYFLTSQTQWGGAAVSTADALIVDANARTIRDALLQMTGPTATWQYWGLAYTLPTSNTVDATGVCGTSAITESYYTFSGTGTGATWTMLGTLAGGVTVEWVFTKQ